MIDHWKHRANLTNLQSSYKAINVNQQKIIGRAIDYVLLFNNNNIIKYCFFCFKISKVQK